VADSVGKTVNSKGTNQFVRTGQTAGQFGNDPSASGPADSKGSARELKP
jgi:hypothetical protein